MPAESLPAVPFLKGCNSLSPGRPEGLLCFNDVPVLFSLHTEHRRLQILRTLLYLNPEALLHPRLQEAGLARLWRCIADLKLLNTSGVLRCNVSSWHGWRNQSSASQTGLAARVKPVGRGDVAGWLLPCAEHLVTNRSARCVGAF